jgi:hypothetical protein
VRRQHTLVLISSLPGTAGLRPFIFFSTSRNSPSIATLTMHANFMLIATPDKHPSLQSGRLNLAWNRFRCSGEKLPKILVSVFRPTCLVFVLYLIGR